MAMPSSQQIKASPVEMPVDVFKAAIEGNSDLLLRLLGLQPELEKTEIQEQTEIQVIEAARPASLASQQIEADQHAVRDILGSVTHFGDTLLHLLVTKKHNTLALIAFQRKRSLLKARNKDFETPLHCAAKVGNDEVIRNLIQLDREFVMESVRETNSNKDTALHVAAKHGHEGVAEELMRLDPRVAYMVNKEEFSPLYLAIVGGYTHMVKNMLNSDSSLACQEFSNGMFPVHVAAQVGNEILVMHFIENYPDDAKLLDRRGWNLCHHFAAEENHGGLIGLVNLSSIKGLINATDYEGNTPLHVATMKGHVLVMRDICKALDRSEMAVRNNQGITAFNLSMNQIQPKARQDLRRKIFSYVLNKGEYFTSEWFNEILESDKEDKNKWERVQVIGLGSVLITTVTFAAAFTIPGGYNQDLGTPILGRKYMFKAFILANTQSFIQAFMSLLMLVLNARYDLSAKDLRYATYTFIAAAGCMVLAFGLGSYVILAPVSLPIAIIVLVYSLLLGSPFMYNAIEINKYLLGDEVKYRKMHNALYRLMSRVPSIRHFIITLNLDKLIAWPILGVSLLGIFLIALA